MTSEIMVAIESTCMMFMLVVLIAYVVLPRSGRLGRDGFFLCQTSIALGLFFDIISWLGECIPLPMWLQYSGNTLCLAITGVSVSLFSYYVIGIIREEKPVSWNYARVISIANFCGTAVVIIAACCGDLFKIVPFPGKDGVLIFFASGLLYDIPNWLSAVSMIVLYAIILRNARALGRNRVIVFSAYFLLPIVAGVLELVNESLQFSYAVSCLNMVIVYVMLQSKHMAELRLREELLNEWSYMDALTGLPNRRAFDRTMEEAVGDGTVNVAFCDLNGLKRVNDEMGHQAGDRYLTGFSGMLTRHFPHDCVFRISGDEFVVIARGMSDEEFGGRIEGLKREIDANAAVAALGTAVGPGFAVSALVKEAEARMYDDKDNYYMNNPGIKRRRA